MTKWISCRDQLPIPNDERNPIYIVTISHPNPRISRKIMFLRYGTHINSSEEPEWYFENNETCDWEVLFWAYWHTKKLPEPCFRKQRGYGDFMIAYPYQCFFKVEEVFTKDESINLAKELSKWHNCVVVFKNLKRRKPKDITWNYINNNKIYVDNESIWKQKSRCFLLYEK